jgi:hypothetical protein
MLLARAVRETQAAQAMPVIPGGAALVDVAALVYLLVFIAVTVFILRLVPPQVVAAVVEAVTPVLQVTLERQEIPALPLAHLATTFLGALAVTAGLVVARAQQGFPVETHRRGSITTTALVLV